jgi:hypothetical protein
VHIENTPRSNSAPGMLVKSDDARLGRSNFGRSMVMCSKAGGGIKGGLIGTNTSADRMRFGPPNPPTLSFLSGGGWGLPPPWWWWYWWVWAAATRANAATPPVAADGGARGSNVSASLRADSFDDRHGGSGAADCRTAARWSVTCSDDSCDVFGGSALSGCTLRFRDGTQHNALLSEEGELSCASS